MFCQLRDLNFYTFQCEIEYVLIESSQNQVIRVGPGLWFRYRTPGLIEIMRLRSVVVIKILFLQPGHPTQATYIAEEK